MTEAVRIRKAVALAYRYGGTDEAHHKAWVIDKMVRVLLTAKDYKDFREQKAKTGYGWDEGIAP